MNYRPMDELARVLSAQRHSEYHYPVVDGVKIEARASYYVPFSEAIRHQLIIEEGFIYSPGEQKIHGWNFHGGLDFGVPYGTPVYAPCDAYVIVSHHAMWVTDDDGNSVFYEGKKVGMGLGKFAQLWPIPLDGTIIQLGHLAGIAKNLRFSKPKYDLKSNTWTPTNHTLQPSDLDCHPMVVRVSRGDLIGYVGTSGLRWGEDYTEFDEESDPYELIPIKIANRSWDGSHLHTEFCSRDLEGDKGYQRDPSGIYLEEGYYQDRNGNFILGPDPLWILGPDGQPLFATS